MKSIDDTLETIRVIMSGLPDKVEFALVGGQAVILQGVERTTIDVDICLYSDMILAERSTAFHAMLQKHLPQRFTARLIQGSRFLDDPFQHDVIFIDDAQGEFFRIDFIIARYKWEVEGIQQAISLPGVPLPVLSKPYLAAMKLRATGFKDATDVSELLRLMTPEERSKTEELAKRIGRDRKLALILNPPEEIREPAGDLESNEELLSPDKS